MITNLDYKLMLVFLYSIFATFVTATYLHRKFLSHNFSVTDRYKPSRPKIATMGGVAALVGILVAIVLSQIIVHEFSTANLLIFFLIITVHAIFGIIDDLIQTSNLIKIIAPYFMALPVSLIVPDTTILLGAMQLQIGALFTYLIAPVYLLVVANLINMHSGFNGLASGISVILLGALGIRSILMGDKAILFYLLPVLAASMIMWIYDRHPAKMIWGNTGSMLFGAAIGAFILASGAEIFGIIILIPHIIDFLLYMCSVIIMRKEFNEIKYGKLRKDGTIAVPTPLKLKFLLPHYFRMTEKQAVNWLHLITAAFCMIGLVLGV